MSNCIENPWIEWNGGECPVERGVLVDVRYRDGEEKFSVPAQESVLGREAAYTFWLNDGQQLDIVAYRLSGPAQASLPKVDIDGWVFHDGKEIPCGKDEFVDIMLYVSEGGGETEAENTELNTKAGEWYWEWETGEPNIGCIVKWRYAVQENLEEAKHEGAKHTHYFKACPYESVDVYRLLEMFNVTDPCLQHVIKKALVAGGRGHKDIGKDVQDCIDTLERWKQMREEESV